jgi:hypothetical protein
VSIKSPQKVFTDLSLYIWRIRYESDEAWRHEILMMGSETALKTIYDALESMKADFKAYGQSTRKFLCNPPEDIDVVRYAQNHRVQLEWLIWLVIRMEPDVADDSQYELKNKVVTICLNEDTLDQFLTILNDQLKPSSQYPHGRLAPGGLFFTQNWLGT